MTGDDRLEALRKRLRLKAREAKGDVPVAPRDLLALLDEVARLVQSGDRLRRQNRRLRLRLSRLGADAPAEDAGDGGEGP